VSDEVLIDNDDGFWSEIKVLWCQRGSKSGENTEKLYLF
jgi:hypothetical protein